MQPDITPNPSPPTGPQPTKAKYDKAFTVVVYHDYKWEADQVPEDYQPKPGEVIVTNSLGKKAIRINNTESDKSFIVFHPNSIQQIHDARQAARLSGAQLPKRSDLMIAVQHITDGVLPHLTDTDAITGFECAEYPEVAAALNDAYEVIPKIQGGPSETGI